MKKITLFAALFIGCVGYVKAETRLVPAGPSNNLQTSDYGGVSYATVTFSTANAMIFTGEGSVLGFVASTNTTSSDFIMFRDTDSLASNVANTDQGATNEFARVYLSTESYIGASNPLAFGRGTSYKFPAPIKVNKGLAIRPVTTAATGMNLITVLYTKFGR